MLAKHPERGVKLQAFTLIWQCSAGTPGPVSGLLKVRAVDLLTPFTPQLFIPV